MTRSILLISFLLLVSLAFVGCPKRDQSSSGGTGTSSTAEAPAEGGRSGGW